MRFRLTAPHVLTDCTILEAGVEVGDGTAVPWPHLPSFNMEPLDEEAVEAWRKRAEEKGGAWGNPIDRLPIHSSQTIDKPAPLFSVPIKSSVEQHPPGMYGAPGLTAQEAKALENDKRMAEAANAKAKALASKETEK